MANLITSYDLPADVFEPGEARPTRTKKSKTPKTADAGSLKRTFSATKIEV